MPPHQLAQLFRGEHAIASNRKVFHPNLLRTHGYFVGTASTATLGKEWDADPAFVKPSTLFVVMEPMVLSVKQLYRRRPGTTVDESLYILQRILRAVVHLQQCGIVHRDIKPDNVMLGGGGGGGVVGGMPLLVKIADFGEALDCVDAELDGFRMPFAKPEPSRGDRRRTSRQKSWLLCRARTNTRLTSTTLKTTCLRPEWLRILCCATVARRTRLKG